LASKKNDSLEGDRLVQRLEQIRSRKRSAQSEQGSLIGDDGVVIDRQSGVLTEPRPDVPRHAAAVATLGQSPTVKRALPMWHENERAGPNVLMRSSLFSIAPPKVRRWVAVASKPREVVCLGEYEISMVGEELRQDDGDVLFGVIHLSRIQARRGGQVQFIASEFIRELGWNRDGHTYKRLHEIFRRLASTLIIVKGKNVNSDEIREAGFSMLQYDFVRDELQRPSAVAQCAQN
jgi:hypothetical protein